MPSFDFLHLFKNLLYLAFLFANVRASGHCGSGLLREYNIFPRPTTCQLFEKDYDTCSSVGNYRATRMPNFLNHHSQEEAYRQLTSFQPLIATQCSSDLQFFLCLYHFPVCVNGRVNPVIPCKELCVRVRDSCSPVMERHNRTWPEQLNCDALPENPSVTCHGKQAEFCVSKPGPRREALNTESARLRTVVAKPDSAVTDYRQRKGSSSVEYTARGDGHSELRKCNWEKEEYGCADYCRSRTAPTNRRQPHYLDWGIMGKVNEVRIGNNCETALYFVNVSHVLRGSFPVGQVVRMKARTRQGCLCPLLQPDEDYFFGRFGSSSPDRSSCPRIGDNTACSMKHKDVAHHLSDSWLYSSYTGKTLGRHLRSRGIPKWLIRLAKTFRKKN